MPLDFTPPPDVSLLLPVTARHVQARGLNEFNPGLGFEKRLAPWGALTPTLGALMLLDSQGKLLPSVFGGLEYQAGPLSVGANAGAVYKDGKVIPGVFPKAAWNISDDVGLSASYIPPRPGHPGTDSVLLGLILSNLFGGKK